MPARIAPQKRSSVAQDQSITLRFGGGVHTRASPDDIHERECVEGENFATDVQNFNLRRRKPFDLVGTAPNAGQINGFATLRKADGTIAMLVQAGTTVYDWDGTSVFTSKGTVVSGAKIRGRLESQWILGDKVIITDLAGLEPVLEYDGSTLANTTFTLNDGSTAWTGDFIAKHCTVDNERAIFANIKDNGTAFPHLVVGSKRSNYTILSNNNRPASGIGAEDPWFLVQPDLKAINGLVDAFNVVIISSEKGDMFKLSGSDGTDFALASLHHRSGAAGDEAVAFAGNDIIFGREGRIESLVATEEFGDVEANDISIDIADQIESFDNWTLAYNHRTQRLYAFQDGETHAWCLNKSLIGSQISPWVKLTTAHALDFAPTAVMPCYDPSDGLEYIFMGDGSGNVYRMEGTGTSGDGGTTEIVTERLSKVFTIPIDAEAFDVQGWIKYKRLDQVRVLLTMEYAGYNVFDQQIQIDIPGRDIGTAVWGSGGGMYWSAGDYWGSAFRSRLTRQKFGIAGRGTDFQVRVSVATTGDFEIAEIGLKFSAATT